MTHQILNINETKINDETIQSVNARELHDFLEIKTRFNDWIVNRIREYDFIKNQDYITLTENLVSGGKRKDYHLSLDMAKELSMVERNDRGKEARQYFIECEKKLKQVSFRDPMELLNDPAAMRGLLSNYAEKVLELESKIANDKPKVGFYDSFVNKEGLYGLQNAGRALQCKPNLFIRWLKESFLFYQGGNLVAKVKYIQQGIFEVKTTLVDDKARPQTFITPKGLEYLAEKMPEHIKLKSA